jgi:hypothetical protein
MREGMRRGLLWAFIIFALTLSVWTVTISSSFQNCSTNQLAAGSDLATSSWRCGLHVVYAYRDAVTAVATVFIAIFTLTLWRSTSGLVMAAAQQSIDTRQAIEASNRNAAAAESAVKTAVASNQIAVTNAERQLRAYVTVQEISMQVHRYPDTIGTLC